MYLSGALIWAFNVWQTIAGNLRQEEPMRQAVYDPAADRPLAAAE
jgi:cytochrome c oxidase cbb3-type subunit 1